MNRKMSGIIGVVIVAILLLAVGCIKPEAPAKPATTEPMPAAEVPAAEETTTGTTGMEKVVVEMTSKGFNPKVVMIKVGQEVVFVNKDTVGHRPASGPHPIHTGYPGSSTSKCGTDQEKESFDSCTAVAPNEEYSFVFVHKGEWQFHDHLNPSMTGTMVVN